MSDYDDDRRYRSHRSRRDDREPRYVETQETYIRSPVAVDPPYTTRNTEIVRRPVREDSDLSIEEVRRDFPPPGIDPYHSQRGLARDDRYGPPVRTRSAERGSQYGGYMGDSRRSRGDFDDRRESRSSTVVEQSAKPRQRSLSRNQKIIAAVGGAVVAVGGKELWDRKQADGQPLSRNALQTAAIGAAGAFAGFEGAELYAKHGPKGGEKEKTYVAHEGRNGDVAEYYSSDEDTVKPKKSRRKSIVEGALTLAGLGAAAKATGGSSGRRSRSRRGSDESYDSRATRSRGGGRGKSPEGAAKFQQAAKAALLAGATEAFRVRNEPGGWGGDKGKRILTAAIGASAIDAAADRDPDKAGKRHILEAVVGGLAGNRLVNGSRKNIEDDGRSPGRRSQSRSRSRGPSGGGAGPFAALATAGLGALAAKKISDRSRSRSRAGGSRRRRDSPDSFDSRSPSPRRDKHKRSKSVSDYARKGLAALGIGEVAEHERDRSRDRDREEVVEETRIRKSRRRADDRRGGDDDGYEPRRSRDAGSREVGSREVGSRDVGYADTRGGPYEEPRYADSRSSNVGSRNGGGSGGGGGDRRTNQQKAGQRNKRVAEGKQRASDSGSESDLGSSSGDEKRIKKMKAPRY